MNNFLAQQPTTNICRIMTGSKRILTYLNKSFNFFLVGPDMSVSSIDINALASQLTSNFLASLTNATVVTTTNNSSSTIPIK